MKNIIKKIIGQKLLGVMDYFRFPEQRKSWGGPLNGQEKRQALVAKLFKELPIKAVIETGTFRGTTTEYFAKLTQVPIYTVEANQRLYGFSWIRLKKFHNVRLLQMDSRAALRLLTQDGVFPKSGVFFYLDAHWGQDLPLAEELQQIFANWQKSWVYIDDFKIEDDAGYGYDDYGSGKSLTLEYISEIVKTYQISVFYPAASSEEETGARRGSVLLANDPALISELRAIDLLRAYPSQRVGDPS
ncbi:MAG: hypothetical protein H6970_06445 [Gammaproteobacteria bacterium]|nr:hypothetical protein [Gammaproteobacteria bacterium]